VFPWSGRQKVLRKFCFVQERPFLFDVSSAELAWACTKIWCKKLVQVSWLCVITLSHNHCVCNVCCSVAVCDESEQVPCVWVLDSVSREARWQDHCVLRQRLCIEELCTEAAEVIASYSSLRYWFINQLLLPWGKWLLVWAVLAFLRRTVRAWDCWDVSNILNCNASYLLTYFWFLL